VISAAKPPTQPSSPGPPLFALAGFTVSSLAGVLVALLLERLDQGVRSGKQLERSFGLPCLGLVPDVRDRAGDLRPHQYLLAKPFSQYAEALRLAHTALRSRVDGPCKVIQVTSALPGEGKTTFAVSLATSLAQNGLRVLLFDLDLRHPTVLREIPLLEGAGFEQFAASERPRDEMVQHDHESGVDVITFKRSRLNPLRLLGSRRMALLIDLLRSSYDYVILDGPPVLGVSDGKVLTEMADAVLFVVRWADTTLDAVEDALKELEAARATIGGAAIVQVDVERHAQYGFGGIDSYIGKYSDYYIN
jgi:capsular exopolysaccharide synthesis family protein